MRGSARKEVGALKKIILCGGGSAGHVMVNLALIPRLIESGWTVEYIGSKQGIEQQLIGADPRVAYHAVSTGKLRRYRDWNNLKDPFRVARGIVEAAWLIRKSKPDVLFSKGGFVSVPVVIGGWLNRVPILAHESDLTPGLANRITLPLASRVLTTFPETARRIDARKVLCVGPVVREELKGGNRARGLALCGFTRSRPVLLVMGGSQGARRINDLIRNNLDRLLADFQVAHVCGKGQKAPGLRRAGYAQFEYVGGELPDLLAACDFVVSRAGSNAIFEFLSLQKPMLLIPLPRSASRGDQILNARTFAEAGYAEVLPEEDLAGDVFVRRVRAVYEDRKKFAEAMRAAQTGDGLAAILDAIEKAAGRRSS